MGNARIFRPLALLLGSTLALSATACGGPGESSTEAKTTDITSSVAGQELTYWSMWKEGEPQQKIIAAAIADFEKESGASVKVQWQGRSSTEKLVPALNTNNVPDIVDGAFAKLAPVIGDTDQGLGLGATYEASVDGKKVSDLIPAKYLANAAIDGKDGQPWMLPYSFSSDGLWFNEASHPELASAPPKTWDEFLATLDVLKKSGEVPLAADGDIAGYNSAWFITLMQRYGGPGAFKELASDKTGSAWDDPQVLEAAKKVESLVKGGYLINGYDSSKWPAQQQLWATGKAALLLNGSWLPTETAPYATPGFKYSSFQFPAVGDKPASVRADFVGFAIPKKAKNAAAAQQLAVFMLKKKYQDAYGTQAKVLPIRTDAATSPEMASIKSALDSAPQIHQAFDAVVFPGYLDKVFNPKNDQLFLGKISAETFLKEMKQAQSQYWKDNG
ncbi:carbohydrate ABC transporter substrate-binding protein, CUT1 family [Arthrobacter sp. FB24]|uniref:ABC transporter substrate-binding protein n=1 Tax=Arthrobacter sp. (strain FB24) TaxID=290399 RepID=UPI0000526F9B|nr:extracellular solute-binding protein [Arthrobacter sp. FB24]ABK03099.1 carbohydrate ABC transporter substrate-binding protein, CUT1 family [Arthrobacter sp. FB24]